MYQITGLKKYYFLLRAMNKELFSLPLGFLLFLIKQMRFEKFSLHSGKVFINSIYTPFPSRSYVSALRSFKRLSDGIMSPISAYISVTDKCHLDCWHCSNYKNGKLQEMTGDDLVKIIKELQEAGVSCIGLTGGEPLLRKDLEMLIRTIDDRSFSVLFTSGHSINEEKAKQLKDAGLTVIVISLDSHIKSEHNAKRSSEVAFDQAVSAIKASLRIGLYTAVSTVVTKQMFDSEYFDDFVRYAGSLGVQEIRLLEPKPCGRLLEKDFEFFTAQDKEKIRQLQYRVNQNKDLPKIMALSHINSRHNYGCNAGRTHVYVNANGDLCPCDFSPVSFGNLRMESFGEVYENMKKAFSEPSDVCIISSIFKHINKGKAGDLPIKEKDKIDGIFKNINKGSIPKLFSKLGFKED